VAPGEEVSGLEDEYRQAAGMPKLLYVKWPAANRQARLTEMLDRIKADDDVSYQRFSTPTDLQRLIETDLAVLLSERFEVAGFTGKGGGATGPAGPPDTARGSDGAVVAAALRSQMGESTFDDTWNEGDAVDPGSVARYALEQMRLAFLVT
jgi:hypothetical protein